MMKDPLTPFKPYLLCVFFIFLFTSLEAQIKKGEKLYQEGRYAEAIRPLKKAFFSKDTQLKAGLMLAESYYELQEYSEALDVANLMGLERATNPDENRLYSDILIANGDYQAAYIALIKLIESDEMDRRTYVWLDKTSDLLKWDSLATNSAVKQLQGVNTIYNEFAPYIKGERLWYIGDHNSVQVLFPTAFTDQNLQVFYETSIANATSLSMSRPSMLLKNREYYYHDGPISYWEPQDKYVITLKPIDGDPYKLKMGLYFTSLSGFEDDMLPFRFNEPYNTGHPSFSEDGNRMYFTSDRPGGFGKMDIWYSDYKEGGWTEPVNMGPTVNTPSNEIFPFIRESRLFFTSDRRDLGYGGMDMYYVSLLSENNKPYNLRKPLNSTHDDFGIVLTEEYSGYFASNRKNGVGGDDVYGLYFEPYQETIDTVKFNIQPVTPGKELALYDSKGKLVWSGFPENNEVILTGVKSREIYVWKSGDQTISEVELAVINKFGDVVERFEGDGNEVRFELLNPEDYRLEKEDSEDLLANMYFADSDSVTAEEPQERTAYSYKGKINNYPTGQGDMAFLIVSELNNISDTVFVRSNGSFSFTVPDNQGTFRLRPANPAYLLPEDVTLDLYTSDNRKLREGISLFENEFLFTLLEQSDFALQKEEVEDDSELNLSLFGKAYSEELQERKSMKIYSMDGVFLSESFVSTDNDFAFLSVPLYSEYLVKTEFKDKGASLTVRLPSLTDSLTIFRNRDGDFHINLNPSETKEERIIKLPEVFYEFDSVELTEKARSSLRPLVIFLQDNPAMRIRIQSHTDARGPSDYNQLLSQRRAEGVVEFLADKGIDKGRLSAEGKGESEPVNKCVDHVPCTNAEHAQNRRTEFAVISE